MCIQVVLLNCKPEAILLAGSFARGRGLVVGNGPKFKFISDLDIYVVGNNSVKRSLRRTQKILSCILEEVYGLQIGLQFIDLRKQHDDFSALDIKYQTKTLYGSSIRSRIKINEKRALNTSIRFLMAKSRHLLYITPSTSRSETILVCSRTYAEITTILSSYYLKQYKPTYLERCRLVNKAAFPGLDKKFINRVVKFTKIKLGFKQDITGSKKDIFIQTIQDLNKTFSFILNIPVDSILKVDELFKERLTQAFFEPYLEEIFERFFKIRTVPFEKALLYLVQAYDLIPTLRLFRKNKIKNVYIGEVISPYIWIYRSMLKEFNSKKEKMNTQLDILWNIHANRREHF